MTLNDGSDSLEHKDKIDKPEIDMTPEDIARVDAIALSPYEEFQAVMENIDKEVPPRMLANFAGHFLMSFFIPGSQEARMAKAVLANIYFYHYASYLADESLLIDKSDKSIKKNERKIILLSDE